MLKIDEARLTELMKDFYSLTGIKICLFDENGRELSFYPEKFSRFCAVTAASDKARGKCLASDGIALQKASELKSRYVYTCPFGLVEAVTPLYDRGELLGYVMLGQMRRTGDSCDIAAIESCGLDREEAEKAYSQLPEMSYDKIKAASHILEALSSYLYMSRLVSKSSGQLKAYIDQYTEAKLSGDIEVDALCRELSVSRTGLYSLFSELYGMPPARAIKEKRLLKAAEMLKYTSLPIKKVAEKVGLADYNYFTKQFKSRFGETPSAFRKNPGTEF